MEQVMFISSELERIKKAIADECVSTSDIIYLMEHKEDVLADGDIRLAEWAGIPEDEYQNYMENK